MRAARVGALVPAVVLVLGCADPLAEPVLFDAGAPPADAGMRGPDRLAQICDDPDKDYDSDGIPNGVESCLNARDSDQDGIPDWQDNDSDGDRVQDHIEKGPRDQFGLCAIRFKHQVVGWPCDTDGDRFPDYLDGDSDGDGLLDGREDENGDGLLGCCLARCNRPGSAQQSRCKLTADGCGAGQTCVAGRCTPSLNFKCSGGESDPRKQDTFGDGKLDSARGTFICRDATALQPRGRKPLLYKRSAPTRGDWHLALEKSARYGELTIANPGNKLAAATIDHTAADEQVAGFVLSREATSDVQTELMALINGLKAALPGGRITVRASGTQGYNHGLYDSVMSTTLDLTLPSVMSISSARDVVLARLLGRPLRDLSNLPPAFGSSESAMVLKFTTVKRAELKRDSRGRVIKDSQGKPLTTGDRSKWRLMVIGALASAAHDQDPGRKTGFILDDLANGTALTVANDAVANECEVGSIQWVPTADFIWVVDESGSMGDNRQDIVRNATELFSRASAWGLDFRMGVTNVNNPAGQFKEVVGKFCSRISTNVADLGGEDRFLTPGEQAIFSSCVNNPPGYEGSREFSLINAREAVRGHLPRAHCRKDRIRPSATLVVIVATDELANSLYSEVKYSYSRCTLSAGEQAGVDRALVPYLDLFMGVSDPQAAAIYHIIGGICGNSCGADVNHGQMALARRLGGQIADICQKNLGNTLQVIIDNVVGAASPVILDRAPISASLAAAMDGVAVARSRTIGFDYRAVANALVFINLKYRKGSEVIASYKRWTSQSFPCQ